MAVTAKLYDGRVLLALSSDRCDALPMPRQVLPDLNVGHEEWYAGVVLVITWLQVPSLLGGARRVTSTTPAYCTSLQHQHTAPAY